MPMCSDLGPFSFMKHTNCKHSFKHQKRGSLLLRLIIIILILATAVSAYKDRQRLLNPVGELGKVLSVEDNLSSEDISLPDMPLSELSFSLSDIPEYSGIPTYVLNDNKPFFTDEDYEKAEESYIELSELDALGRCGVCTASLGKDTMPEEERDFELSLIKPSGWKQEQYPDLIETNDGNLFHRAHLIAWKLSGIEAEERAIITGTEQLNEAAMLPYEKAAINWLYKEGGRILYRATPVFEGYNLVCSGVLLEGADVETKGEKFHFNIWCYNVQDGVGLDYLSGKSWRE